MNEFLLQKNAFHLRETDTAGKDKAAQLIWQISFDMNILELETVAYNVRLKSTSKDEWKMFPFDTNLIRVTALRFCKSNCRFSYKL